MSKHFSTTNVPVQREHCGIITCVIFWLKGVVGGKLPGCFLLEVAKSHPFFFPNPFATLPFKKATPPALWRGVNETTPFAVC